MCVRLNYVGSGNGSIPRPATLPDPLDDVVVEGLLAGCNTLSYKVSVIGAADALLAEKQAASAARRPISPSTLVAMR